MLRRASTSKSLCSCLCLCPASASRSITYAPTSASSSENARARRNGPPVAEGSQYRSSRYSGRSQSVERLRERPRGPPAFPPSPASRRANFPRRDPYNLAASLEELCQAGKIEEAVEKLRTAKKEAVNAAVYNILLQQVLAAGKNNLAWDLWMEMKRSGIVPTPRSYTVFFSSVVPESVTASFLQRIKTIYSQWLDFCGKKTAQDKPEEGERDRQPTQWQDKAEAISDIPGNAFLTLLSRLQEPDLDGMLQTFLKLPATGPTAPTRTTYTTVLFALVRQNGRLLRTPTSSGTGANSPDVDIVMSEANILSVWQRYLQDVEKRRLRMDARSISPMLRFWCQMAPRDRHNSSYRNAALDCIHQVFGLARDIKKPEPGLADMTKEEHDRLVWLDQESFLTVLQVAAAFSQKKLAEIWFEQVRNGELPQKRGAPLPIDKRHCEVLMKLRPDTREELLIWLLRQPGIQFRPDNPTYLTALGACRFHADFALALRVIAFISGKEDDLLIKSEARLLETDEEAELSKRMAKGYHTKKFTLSPSLLMEFVETAKATKDWRRLDRAIKVVDFVYKPAKSPSSPSGDSNVAISASQADLSGEEAEVLQKLRQMQVEIAKSVLQRGTFTSYDSGRRKELLKYLPERREGRMHTDIEGRTLRNPIRRRSV